MTKEVLSCLSTGVIPASLNGTFITLIPKVKSPTKVSEFRLFLYVTLCISLLQRLLPTR